MRATSRYSWRRVVPGLISIGLVTWLVWRLSPEEIARAAASLNWPLLALLTAVMVLGLFAWDAVCLRWLFSQSERPLSYPAALRARAGSYLWSALNYEAGQAVLAWRMARAQETPLLSALGGCVLLAFHDLGVLMALGLAGALASSEPHARFIARACAVGLSVQLGLVLVWMILPERWRDSARQTRWGNWLGWWQARHSVRLCLLRALYFSVVLIYAAAAVRVCGVPLDWRVVSSVIPLVLLADSLPSVSGFGTRDTALLTLLQLDREQQALLLNFSLFWSAGLLTGRLGLGLAEGCWPHRSRHAPRDGAPS